MVPDPSTGHMVPVATSLRRDPTYVALYVVWSKFLFTELAPYLAVVALNVVIIAKSVRAAAFRRQAAAGAGTIRVRKYFCL